MNELLKTLTARGLLQDATAGVAERLEKGPITAYVGFDPTAESLHVGNLIPVMGAAWLQRFGHAPIILIGGGTGMVGDPSGKRSERPIIPLNEIDRNAESIRHQLSQFLDFKTSRRSAARFCNNADWLRDLRLMDFLRDAGRSLRLGAMLHKESVSSRMEAGLSYAEFSYMAIQAYDFWHLFKNQQCELQIGGSDQWGNITAGIELIGKQEGKQAYGLVFPLVTTASGTKFGKSETGNIWLDPAKTSPYEFYQFWINTDDRDVERYLKLFTFLSLQDVAQIISEHQQDPGKRVAQKVLAQDLTTTVHGEAATQQAMHTTAQLFRSTIPVQGELTIELLPAMPTRRISVSQLSEGWPIIDVLVLGGLASSKGDARRGIQGSGFYINGQPISNVDRRLTEGDLQGPPNERFLILRKGKKNYVRLILEP